LVARRDYLKKSEARSVDFKHADIVAAGIDRIQKTVVRAESERSLRIGINPLTETARFFNVFESRYCTVARPSVGNNLVAFGGVRHSEHRADGSIPPRLGECRRAENHGL